MNERSTEKGEHFVAASGVKVSVLGEVEHVKTAIEWLNNYSAVVAENKRLKEFITKAFYRMVHTPELNMSNFSDDDIAALNQGAIDVNNILSDAVDYINKSALSPAPNSVEEGAGR